MTRRLLPWLVTLAAVAAASLPSATRADTGANCTYDSYIGVWTYHRGPASALGSALNCTTFTIDQAVSSVDLQLSVPNIVTLLSNNDEEAAAAAVTGSETGNFTLVYNQGVELWLGSEVWFAFSSGNYTHTQDECATTRPGWVHQIGAGPDSEQDWACFIAIKQQEDCGSPRAEQQHKKTKIILEEENAAVTDGSIDSTEDDADSLFRTDHDLIARINAAQSSWVAAAYPEHERRTIREMQRRRGTPLNSGGGGGGWESFMPPRSSALQSSQPAYPSSAASIPDSFDWRNVSGVNFVSPVRDQSGCGSCYVFSTLAMLESRIRISSVNALQPVLSPQNVISCSQYSQGCQGGFPYLASKFTEDFGVVDEDCMPYIGDETPCVLAPEPTCTGERWAAESYNYVGGYFGMSDAEAMQREIIANGPVAVCFQVEDDFDYYKSGVYVHNSSFVSSLRRRSKDGWEPTVVPVNHAVLAVGWGVTDDAAALPYWIIKNSWSKMWGEEGYFRILRSTQSGAGATVPIGGECGIESMAVAAQPRQKPIPPPPSSHPVRP